MRRLLLIATGLVCLAASAWGQSPAPPSDQAALIKSLLARVDKLEKRVNELERKQACPSGSCEQNVRLIAANETSASMGPAAPTPGPEVATAPSSPAVRVAQVPASQAAQQDHDHMAPLQEQTGTFPSMQIRGFGDVDFGSTNQPGAVSGFNLGQFVLHITSPLSKKVTYFGEVSFTAEQSGSYNLQVERTIIRYD
jgi:hypothetical protein